MTWTEAFREICEAYPGITPLDLQEMHIDMILLLLLNKKFLKGGRRYATGTPAELRARGLLSSLPQKSLMQEARELMRKQEQQKRKGTRRGV